MIVFGGIRGAVGVFAVYMAMCGIPITIGLSTSAIHIAFCLTPDRIGVSRSLA
jgi:hypothetical protein